MTAQLLVGLLSVVLVAAGAAAGGAGLSWWLVCRAYDRGYRAGVAARRRDLPAQRPSLIRLPRRSR